MKFFNRSRELPLLEKMESYINSILPDGVACRQTAVEDDALMFYSSTHARLMAFNLQEGHEELTDADKEMLIREVVIPMLQQLDDELKSFHGGIKKTLKELGVE